MVSDFTPNVSVIIPHFERAALLRETVASVLASSEQSFEIIIVDDGSSSAQWEMVKAQSDSRVIVMQRSDGIKGPSRCRNLGLAAARGEFVMFLDSDDLLAPWCLEQRLRVARANDGEELLVFPVLLFSHQPGDCDKQWNTLESPDPDLNRFLQSDPVWHTSSPLWRRNVILALGGFNEMVFYGDDADLHIRALMSGIRVKKYANSLPDIFIRRSSAARITNSLPGALIESRRIRLQEGTRFLKSKGALESLQIWEGQYFFEAEFLLYNTEDSRNAIRAVLTDWKREFHPDLTRRLLLQFYLQVALVSLKKLYILVRLVRRLMIACLPTHYFPRGGSFQQAPTPGPVFFEVSRRLVLSQ